jgi:hypothetical protein
LPSSIGLSPLCVGHPSRYTSTGCDPPSAVRRTSICPRIDHIGFRSIRSDLSLFLTTRLSCDARSCFRFGFRLATPNNSLALASRRTIRCRWDTNTSSLATGRLRVRHSFHTVSSCHHTVSSSFHTPSGALFSILSRYLFAIGLDTIFSVGGCYPRLHARYPTGTTRLASLQGILHTRLSLSLACHSRHLCSCLG